MQTITNDQRRNGGAIEQLAAKLSEQQKNAKDFRVPTSHLSMNRDGKLGFGGRELNLNNWSSGQLASYCDIPKRYFDRIQSESPGLLSTVVNHDLRRKTEEAAKSGKNESRLIRTVGNKTRAIVSNSFQVLDAYDLINTAYPMLMDNGFEPLPRGCELTEKRVYLKATTKRIETEVKKGDVVQFGIMLSTSDVGAGSLAVEPFINRLVCLNGMVMSQGFKRRHVGKRNEINGVEVAFSNDIYSREARLFFDKLKETLAATMRPEVFEREVNKMRAAAEIPIKDISNLEKTVEVTSKLLGVSGDDTRNNILEALASGNQGADLTMWGLSNSFTAAAKLETDFDKATELERVGGQILDLSPNQWRRISEPA
jgi:hypothetical protein